MARPLRKGEGGKGPAIKERKKKEKNWNFFKILLPFKNKNYFTLDNLSKYGHTARVFQKSVPEPSSSSVA